MPNMRSHAPRDFRTPRLAALLAFSAALFLCAPRERAAARTFTSFDILGDSIAQGFNSDSPTTAPSYGWADMLFGRAHDFYTPPAGRSLRDLWPAIRLHNTARAAKTAADWAREEPPLLAEVLAHEPDLIVIALGINDILEALLAGPPVDPAALAAQYGDDMRAILAALRASPAAPEILLLNQFDLFAGRSEDVPALYAVFRPFSAAVERCNAVLAQIAAEEGLTLIDLDTEFYHRGYGGELGDPLHRAPEYFPTPLTRLDVHPNTRGHARIYQLVFDRLCALASRAPAHPSWTLLE